VYARRRNLVPRADGRLVNVARPRGQLFVCATGCCCGRTQDGWPAVPTELYHQEWERRRLRNVVHLTIGGCLGPCALANVVLLLFDGQALWFHSMDTEALVRSLYDAIAVMLDGDVGAALPPGLVERQFTASAWQPRPDGQPVDDVRPRRAVASVAAPAACGSAPAGADEREAGDRLSRLLAGLEGATTVPRRNGELVFEAPWQGRVFGMAVALSEQGVFSWEEFRQALIVEVAAAAAREGEFRYYEAWLAAFERVLIGRRIVASAEVDETAYQFEFGERDDVP
jgi:nitrile hydratase accessory protein